MKIKTSDELLELFDDVDKFNFFISDLEEKIIQRVILLIPQIVVKHIQDENKYAKILNKFYSENPKLAREKVIVGRLINKIVNEDPGIEIEEVFKKVTNQIYPMLEAMKDEKSI